MRDYLASHPVVRPPTHIRLHSADGKDDCGGEVLLDGGRVTSDKA